MKAKKTQRKRNRSGFSMIEVLVASTILVVIVMLLGMLFQQTSLAWTTGVRRADSFMQVRSLIGAIQRDASAAIDARDIPEKSLLGGGDQNFRSWPLRFYTLTGGGFVDDNPSETPLRALSYITYTAAGQRTETLLDGKGATHNQTTQIKNFITKTGSTDSSVTTTLEAPSADFEGVPSDGLPRFLTLKVTVNLTRKSYDIGAASAGPDKTWDTKDDIRTWSED